MTDRAETLRSRIDRLRVERVEAEASLAAIVIALSVAVGELFELLDSDEYLLASDPGERCSFEAAAARCSFEAAAARLDARQGIEVTLDDL
jgi:hypothetical protein